MPHLTLDIEALGPIVQVGVGVSEPVRAALVTANRTLPALQISRALVDTGASCSVVDEAVVKALGLSPVSFATVHTPSTAGKPIQQPVYDVSIWLYHAQTKYVWERSFPVGCAVLRAQGIDMLLGRDVLAECLLICDGPERRFTISF